MTAGSRPGCDELPPARVPFVHATVVRAQEPTSAQAGDDAVVLADGTIEGFVGGQCAESRCGRRRSARCATARRVLLRVLPDGERAVPGVARARRSWSTPACPAGRWRSSCEPLLPAPLVAVVGSTPVADALVAIAGVLDYATARSLPGSGARTDASAVVVASHGRDEPRRSAPALDAGVAFIALVASRRRGAAVLDELDLTAERARPGSTPRPGSTSAPAPPAEIALSILAEVIGRCGRPTGSTDRPAGRAAAGRAAAAADRDRPGVRDDRGGRAGHPAPDRRRRRRTGSAAPAAGTATPAERARRDDCTELA